ncbi:Rev2 protein, partial [SIV-wrc Pbt-05GM-X02]
ACVSAESYPEPGRGTARQRRNRRRRFHSHRRIRLAVQERIADTLLEQLGNLTLQHLPEPPAAKLQPSELSVDRNTEWVESSQKTLWSSVCCATGEDCCASAEKKGEGDIHAWQQRDKQKQQHQGNYCQTLHKP